MVNIVTKEPKRFWRKVDVRGPNECWEWQAGKFGKGYGYFRIHGKLWKAHRVSWLLTYGPIPEGLFVLHHCDNPSCCNPYHLFLGTKADNSRDMVEKGRSGNLKLTKEDVREIRTRLEAGETQRSIADDFGVRPMNISYIKHGKSWSWLK